MRDERVEQPFFFEGGGPGRLFGVLHPAAGAARRGAAGAAGVVICHPFAEEKLVAHRAAVSLARRLAAEGFACLRFDFSGHGDSGGSFEEATVEAWTSDIAAAARTLRERTGAGAPALVGLRLGGSLAFLAAGQGLAVEALVLAAPLTNGRAYFEQCLRSNLTTQMAAFGRVTRDRAALIGELEAGLAVNIDGYLVGPRMYRGLSAVDLLQGPAPSCPTLIVRQRGADLPGEGGLEELRARLESGGARADLVEVNEEPFWKEPKVIRSSRPALEEAVSGWLGGMFRESR